MKKLSVVYRTYSVETNGQLNPQRPAWFCKKRAFRSFYNSFGEKADIHILWDGTDLDSPFFQYLSSFKLAKIHQFDKLGNQASLSKTYDILEETGSPFVMTQEDDYYFLDNSYQILIEGLHQFQSQLVYLYDCPHRYLPEYKDVTFGKEYISSTQNSYWRTSESIMCSVAMSAELLKDIKPMLNYFCKKGQGGPNDRESYRYFLNNGIRVWTPMPTRCTHAVTTDLSLFVDWAKYNTEIGKNYIS